MKNFTLIFVYLFSLVSFAQNDFEFTTGIPEKSVRREVTEYWLTDYLFDDKKTIISIKTTRREITIQRHDAESLEEISRNLYTDLPEGAIIQKIAHFKNKLAILYSITTQSNITVFYLREIDKNEGKLLAPYKCFEGSGRIRYFQFFDSADKSKILIQYGKVPVSSNNDINYDVLGFYVLTSDLNIFSGTEVQMPLTESQLRNISYTVSNSGLVYFLSKNIQAKKIELRTITDKTLTNIPIHDLDSTFLKISFDKAVISENSKGNLICTGYYMNGIDANFQMIGVGHSLSWEENDNGIFHFEISKSGKFIKKTIYEFPLALINQNESKSVQNKNDQNEKKDYAGIKNLEIVKIVENTDGSLLVIGSQKTSLGMAYYTYGNILVCKIDESGKLLWINKIPRNMGGYYCGLNYYKYKDIDYIFFADNAKNENVSDNEAPKYFLSEFAGNFIAYKIDDTTGKSSRSMVLDINNINGICGTYFFRNNFIETFQQTLVIEIMTDKHKEVFVKMKIK